MDTVPYLKHDSNWNIHLFSNLAITADRFGLSNVAVAAIVNAAQQDLEVSTDQNKLNKNKVRRERKRTLDSNTLQSVTNVIDI